MLSSKLISADVCGTVMDSLSVQMAQVRRKLLLLSPNFSGNMFCWMLPAVLEAFYVKKLL